MAHDVAARASTPVSESLQVARGKVSNGNEGSCGGGGYADPLVKLDIWGRPAKETPHRFEWALAILKAGGKVRLSHWLAGCYICVKGDTLVYSAGMGSESESGFVLEWCQITSTNWQAA